MNIVSLDQLRFEDFAGLVKATFAVESGPGVTHQLELADATPRRLTPSGRPGGLSYEQFTLVWLGPADRLLPQRMYWFENPTLGRFELFIVPVGHDANGIRYEAQFNRPVTPGSPESRPVRP